MKIFWKSLLTFLFLMRPVEIFIQTTSSTYKMRESEPIIGKLCERLPNGCKLKRFQMQRDISMKKYLLVCPRLDQDFKFDFDRFISKKDCNGFNYTDKIYTIYFRLTSFSSTILDESFDYLNVIKFLKHLNRTPVFIFRFRNIKGFDIEAFEQRVDQSIRLRLDFYSSRLNFYQNKRLIKSCENLKDVKMSIFMWFHPRQQLVCFKLNQVCQYVHLYLKKSTLKDWN